MGRLGNHKQILIIDDDRLLLTVLSFQLSKNGFSVKTAQTGTQGLVKAMQGSYDVIILDMGLPDRSGLSVCKELRKNGILTPILVLSGDTNKRTIVSGLRTGADDYLEKPFHATELIERLKALIRRNERQFPANILSFNDIQLDTLNYALQTKHQSLKLTAIEMSVMRCLIQHAPRVMDRSLLFEQVWGINDEHASNRLEVYIKRLRYKLAEAEAETTIQTAYGKGYRLK
jgi:DNA-binding response OmpR family regulator